MEVYAVAILAGAGYLISRLRQSRPTGTSPPVQQAVPQAVLAADAPGQKNVWESRRFQDVLLDEQARGADMARKALDPASSGVVSRHERALWSGEPLDSDARQQQGGSVFSSLLGRDVPVERFTHNNMVPFYRGTLKQPVSDSAFSARLETFTGAFDEVRPLGTRTGAAPSLFRPTVQGPIDSSGRAAVAGFDSAREAFFETQQTRNRANEVPEGLEPQIVGRPGVQGGETGDVYYDMREAALRAAPTVDDLRPTSRPKMTFEGRVLPGASPTTSTDRPDAPGLAELRHGGPVTREMVGVDDLLRTTGASGAAPKQRPPDLADLRSTNRLSTSAEPGYIGPAGGGAVGSREQVRAAAAGRGVFRSCLGAPPVGSAVAASSGARAGDYGKGSILVYGNNRDVTTLRTRRGNIVSAIKAAVAPIVDAIRPTRKDDAVDAPRAFGNAAGPRKATVYDPDDVARTTLREAMVNDTTLANPTAASAPSRPTMHFDPVTGIARTTLRELTLAETPHANLRGPTRGVVYDPEEVARVARRQTTLAATPYANLAGPVRGVVHDPEDVARSTRKETTLAAAEAANVRPGAFGASVVYDPDAVAKTTRKEISLQESPQVNLHGGRQPGTMPYSDCARTTIREVTAPVDATRNMSPAARPEAGAAYDPDAWAGRPTLRQTLDQRGDLQDGNVGGLQGTRSGGYANSEYDARVTQRQVADEASGTTYGVASASASDRPGSYASGLSDYDPRVTQKETLSDHEYYGAGVAADVPNMPTSSEGAQNMISRTGDDREAIAAGREPTPVGAKASTTIDAIGSVLSHGSGGLAADERSPSPGVVVRPPPRIGDEGQIRMGRTTSPRLDDAEHGATTLTADRLADLVAGVSAQRSTNETAQPAWAL